MATIAFLLDLEEGHFFPTFQLAKNLRRRGHHIHYLGPAKAEALVRQEGFGFVPILEDVLAGVKRTADATLDASALETALFRNRALDDAIERLRPDVMILLSLYCLEALLIRYRYRVPVVLVTHHLRRAMREVVVETSLGERLTDLSAAALNEVLGTFAALGLRLRSFWDLAQLVLRMPELVLQPRAFELPELANDPRVTYIGSGIDLERTEEPFFWDGVDARLPLIYCSLGSQCDVEAAASRRFFRCVIDAAAARPDLQFLLSLSKGFAPSDFQVRSANLRLGSWLPQLTVLGRARVMVTHAGLGTVKECILRGVPMVAVPLMRDQFGVASRVVRHGLGVQGEMAELTPDRLCSLIDTVATEPAFTQRVLEMQRHFLDTNDSRQGVEIVEAAIAQR